MKILMINSVSGIRSTGRICTDLADVLAREGHTVRIAYGRESVPEAYRPLSVRIGTEAGVYANSLKARLLDNEGFNAKAATRRFLKWADGFDPDLLWLHNLHGYYIHLGMLFSWIKSRPNMKVRWTLHDCWPFTGHCAHFTLAKCDAWKTGCHSCKQKKSYPKSLFADRSKKNYLQKKRCFTGVKDMLLITPSRWLAELVGQSFLGEYPVKVVHNSINTEIFQPTESDFKARHALSDKKIVLGVATAWSESKGLSDFVRLAEILGDGYRVVLVGIPPEIAKTLPDTVLALPSTNSARELAELYTAADFYVNLTYEDNFPTTNIEALASGTPVITYRTGGSPEIADASSGFVLEQGDVTGVAEIIRREGGKEKYREACIARAARFDRRAAAGELLAAIGIKDGPDRENGGSDE